MHITMQNITTSMGHIGSMVLCGGEIGSTGVIKVTAKRKATFAAILGVKKEVTSSSAQALAAIA